MTETARVLLTAAILSAVVLGAFVWRLTRAEVPAHARLVGQLHLSQWAAVVLAVSGAAYIGLAVGGETAVGAPLELAVGLVAIAAGLLVLRCELRQALLVAAVALWLHAGIDLSHRPGWLAADLAPAWFRWGAATYDVYIGVLCWLARRKKGPS